MHLKKEINKNWYALYTRPRAEKKVVSELIFQGFEVFLPVQRTLKQWSDRKKWVEEPLFKSYLFINTQIERNYYTILNTPGVVNFVNFGDVPAIVDQREIELVKLLLGNFNDIESIDTLADNLLPGDDVEIVAGPLMGTRGKLIQFPGAQKIKLEITSINQNLMLSLPKTYIRKV